MYIFDVTILYENIFTLFSYIIDDSAQIMIKIQNTNKKISLKSESTCYKTKCESAFVLQVCACGETGVGE